MLTLNSKMNQIRWLSFRVTSMIYTEQEIEERVSKVKGTHIKRNNLRKKLQAETNNEIAHRINVIKKEIRKLKADGFNEQDLRGLYANITKLELQKL